MVIFLPPFNSTSSSQPVIHTQSSPIYPSRNHCASRISALLEAVRPPNICLILLLAAPGAHDPVLDLCSFPLIYLSPRNAYSLRDALASISRSLSPSTRSKSASFRSIIDSHCANHSPNTPLTLVFHDLDRFSPSVLADLVHLASTHAKNVPISLIFALSSPLAIHSLLPRSLLLPIQPIALRLPSPESILARFLRDVCLSPEPSLRPSPRVLSHLIHEFNSSNNNIETFISKIEYMKLAHSNINPLAPCILPGRARLSDSFAKTLRAAPSFQEWIKERIAARNDIVNPTPFEVIKDMVMILSADDTFIDRFHSHFLPNISRHCRLQSQAYKLYELIRCTWATPPSILQDLPRLYSGQLVKRSLELSNTIRKSSDERILDFLTLALPLVRPHKDYPSDSDILPNLAPYHTKINKLRDSLSQHNQSSTSHQRQHLANINVPGAISKSSLDHEFTTAVTSLSDELCGFFSSTFQSYHELVFHEIIYFDHVELLEANFHPQLRSVLSNSLLETATATSTKATKATTTKSTVDNIPDISRAYRLFLDAGKIINLGDWYTAFDYEVSSKRKTRLKRKRKTDEDEANPFLNSTPTSSAAKTTKINAINQARFAQSVAELGYLGYIARTQRKTEHVARIVYD